MQVLMIQIQVIISDDISSLRNNTMVMYTGITIDHYQLLKIIILNLNTSILLAQLGNIFQYSPRSVGQILYL